MSDLLSLKWNHHNDVFLKLLKTLRIQGLYCDATLICQGSFYPVHKFVLATCSKYFQDIFEKIDCNHPFIIIKDVESDHLEKLLNYMYNGEVNVVQDSLATLIKIAESLQIRGLAVPESIESNVERAISKKKLRNFKLENQKFSPSTSSPLPNEGIDINGFRNNEVNRNEAINPQAHLDFESSNNQVDNAKNLNNAADFCTISEEEKPMSIPVIVKVEPLDVSESYMENLNPMEKAEKEEEFSSRASAETNQQLDPSTMFVSNQTAFEMPNNVETIPPEDKSLISMEFGSQQAGVSSNYSAFKHKCAFCGYGSYFSSAVRRHEMRKHTGIKPFQCSLCNYSSTTKNGLRAHIRRHTGEKPFVCHLCSYKSACDGNLKRHMKKVHKELLKDLLS